MTDSVKQLPNDGFERRVCMGWRIVQVSGFERRVCSSPASPILADELHTRHSNPRSMLSVEPMYLAGTGIKAPGGKAFLHASIGEAGEKASPP